MGLHNEEVEVEESLGTLGIIDFFNVLFTGGIFTICLFWICPWLWTIYEEFNKNYEYESYVGVIMILFLLGIILQEIGSFFDEKYGKIKSNVLNGFLHESTSNERNTIIDNDIKVRIYRKHAKKILREKDERFENDFSPVQCQYIYAYCLYYIEYQGKSAKYEKMRGLFDMARTLVAMSILLLIASIIRQFYNVVIMQDCCAVITGGFQLLLFTISTIIFQNRAKRIMNYKVRILMEEYDVCVNMQSKYK